MSKSRLSQKKKGLIGLGAMVVVAGVVVFGSDMIYDTIQSAGKASIYTPGVYSASAQGYGGEVIVSITVSDKVIQSVEITGADETPGIGSNAVEQMPAAIVAKQGMDIDAVSGATVTSGAIMKAGEQALLEAQGSVVAE